MKYKKTISVFLALCAVFCIAAIFFVWKNAFVKPDMRLASENAAASADAQETAGTETVSGEPEAGNNDSADESSKEAEEQGEAAQDSESAEENAQATDENAEAAQADAEPQNTTVQVGDQVFHGGFEAASNADTIAPADTDVLSQNSILIDVSTDTILVEKGADDRISPASMTKVLTILVAAEQIPDLDGTFTITPEMTSYCLNNGCSAAGFVDGEVVPIRDLFYGTILPSGGEAAVALATCAAGSHEQFVELMNAKLEELGLSDSAHMTNCVGLYDENHYCTAYDMAMIMKAAVENDWCRQVLSTKVYTTQTTTQNPEGIVLSNWFLRRIEDKDCGGEVLCAKTGFVQQSGDCAVSYGISASGKPYICVTVNTYNSWRCIYDHVALYKQYAA